MKQRLRAYPKAYLPRDLLSGFVIAAVSIPISMGYAQIAGLPAVYGLYGSVLPVLLFGLLSSSPQFIFGVDAAPAAMVGALLASLGVTAGSEQAVALVPVLSFYTACWLALFALLRAGKVVDYISQPVMGGFISGICCEIILMQTPKLLGGAAGHGELFQLLGQIASALRQVNPMSLIMGLAALAALLAAKKLCPRFPMAIVIMVLGALTELWGHVSRYGVPLLAAVEPGLPRFALPDFGAISLRDGLGSTLSIAVVIMAETLLAEHNFAQRTDTKLRDNREIAAFALGNFAAAFCGCCPVNGSVSRSSMNEQLGGKTQLVSVIAGLLMCLVLLFAADLIQYLPVPVLTAIVISALMSAVELHLAKKLWRVSKKELAIFLAAMAGVLLFGTIYGVIIGIVLSFVDVLIRAAQPRRSFLGCIEGRLGFYCLDRMRDAKPLPGVVLYQFSGSLFFANCHLLQEDILQALQPDTRVVIVDASGVGSIDFTAAELLVQLHRKLRDRGVRFYLTEHIGQVNDELRQYGAGCLIEEGVVRRTIALALLDAGINGIRSLHPDLSQGETIRQLQEFEWAYGKDAEAHIDTYVGSILTRLQHTDPEQRQQVLDHLLHQGVHLSLLDSDDLLLHLQAKADELARLMGSDSRQILQMLETEHRMLLEQIRRKHPEVLDYIRQHIRQVKRQLELQEDASDNT